jgi:hypothetical protein
MIHLFLGFFDILFSLALPIVINVIRFTADAIQGTSTNLTLPRPSSPRRSDESAPPVAQPREILRIALLYYTSNQKKSLETQLKESIELDSISAHLESHQSTKNVTELGEIKIAIPESKIDWMDPMIEKNETDSDELEDDLPIAISQSLARISLPEEDALCTICLSAYNEGEPIGKLSCRHHFHYTCVKNWLKVKKSCPLCVRAVEM